MLLEQLMIWSIFKTIFFLKKRLFSTNHEFFLVDFIVKFEILGVFTCSYYNNNLEK